MCKNFNANLITLLPDEIIRCIIPYTYMIQKKELLEQIKSYVKKYKKYQGMNIYLVNYNVLRIMSGISNIAYYN